MGRARAPGGGRRPTPTALKLLNGNPGRRPLNHKEPRPPKDLPEAPAILDGEARDEWDRISAQLHRCGLLTAIDRGVLTTYCLAWARVVEAQAKLREHGSVVLSPNRFPVQSPYLAVLNKAIEQMTRAAVELGMTPSSRSRVQGTADLDGLADLGEQEEDPAIRWMREFRSDDPSEVEGG